MQMYKLQENIRNNTNDVNQAVHDLINWSAKVNTEEKKIVGKTAATKPQQLPPIRNKIDIQESIKQAQERKAAQAKTPLVPELEKFKRDNTAMPDYYKAWDKFGKALDDIDDDEVEQAKNPAAVDVRQP